jgi:hypothetical protein
MSQSKLDKSGRAPDSSDLDNDITLNRPTSPTNTPQHLVSEEPEVTKEEHLDKVWPILSEQTGEGTAPPDLDVADPHPPDEEHYGRIPHPGGANPPPPNMDMGADPGKHDGTPQPPPANAERDKY